MRLQTMEGDLYTVDPDYKIVAEVHYNSQGVMATGTKPSTLSNRYNAFADLKCEDPEAAVKAAIKALKGIHGHPMLYATECAPVIKRQIESALALFGISRVDGEWRAKDA